MGFSLRFCHYAKFYFFNLVFKPCFWAIKSVGLEEGDRNEKHGQHGWRTISFEKKHFGPLT